MGILKQIAEYLFLKKKDPNEHTTTNQKLMHGSNRISIFMFLLCLLLLAYKLFIKPKL